jgi:2,4-dienoyl-CoA reductase-like NADH-dependent reductase (Old Yellow Enzyme family)
MSDAGVEALFSRFESPGLQLSNRFAMAPMTRLFSPHGVSTPQHAKYYRRRAEGGVGLVITEGTWIDTPVSGFFDEVPRFHGEAALAAWQLVCNEVHAAGARIMPQLWHVGMLRGVDAGPNVGTPAVGPSGIDKTYSQATPPMTGVQIDETIDAYARGALQAKQMGFDGVELHAAHGYLIDQFFWERTNLRQDRYGGDLRNRTRFACEIVEEIHRRAGADFPVSLRFSQWKYGDYSVKLFHTPDDLAQFVEPLAEAGVNIFHCSTRRYWDAPFAGSDRSLAGWTKFLSNRVVIAVGSVGLGATYDPKARPDGKTDKNYSAVDYSLEKLLQWFDRGEFDLIALGRILLSNPCWPALIRESRMDEIRAYDVSAQAALE